ncbi:putative receptor-like protein kinase At3g47110 isoform X2 [Quercus lobata]|uniref:putative receptor-like protein kinase At3g47110 isoform X2 n=1 Tax=Quercus lobata TaxID=97700 RepID=UPI001246F9FF|nr:putative receptor-like protein kinase At3g47110 isoform X2 [Quercus lobata]
MKSHNPNFPALLCSTFLNIILLFTVTFLCLKPATSFTTPTNETDRLALLKFKESIDNDPYGILSSWNDSFHFCNWHGITCGRHHQRVTTLELQGHNLRGTIPPYIGNLTFLRAINLQDNSFYGEIPKEVGQLFRLRELSLTNNTLGGEIPTNLSNCSELRLIRVSNNKLIGKIPMELGSLTKLIFLRIAKNNFIGIPGFLGNLSSLIYFSAGYNDLKGNIPESVGRLKSLSYFAVGINKLNGMVPSSLYNISSIRILSLIQNQLGGTLPENIGHTLPNLQHFTISDNKFFGSIPSSLCNASKLQLLALGNNSFVGSVPTNLGYLQDLQRLNLDENKLGRDLNFLTSLRNCSKMNSLSFVKNRFEGVLPSSIGNLSTQLTKLYLGGNKISGTIPVALQNLINLIALGMDGNVLTGMIPTSFGKFQKMQALSLSENKLSGKIPSSIGNLTQLAELVLSQNNLEGSIPPSIGTCQSLQLLDVAENYLSGVIPQQVFQIFSLSLLLNLSHNSFTGKLPVEVDGLKNINSIDVSKNNFSGEIPTTIGNCLNLVYLGLQGNSFNGTIPSSMASLKSLEHLDVSRNNLSGLIPKGLDKLLFLKYLNISFNNIEGEVPTGGVFRNVNAISVIGNNKLCGGIPQLQLTTCHIVTKSRKSFTSRVTITIICVVACILLVSSFLVLYWRKRSKRKLSSIVLKMDLLPTASYKMLHQATNGFSPDNLIGSGSFGSVYKGVLDQEERLVAIKVLNLQNKDALKSFMAECKVLRNIRHRNLIKILTCCSSINYNGDDFKALVFEFMTNGNLEMWLHSMTDSDNQSKNLSVLQRLIIAIDVAFALNYLHNHCEQKIIHCDLKPSNILLDSDMIAHVSDFGLSRLLTTSNDSSQKCTSTIGLKGSIGYAAPEYGMGSEASAEGDVYSYGVLVLEMFTGRRPTDDMFKDGLNLHNFVKMSLPKRLIHVVDPMLLPREVEGMGVATAAMMATKEDDNDNEIEEEEANNTEDFRHIDVDMQKCLLSILNIGILCSLESPKERINMEEVIKELQMIKSTFVGLGIHREAWNN